MKPRSVRTWTSIHKWSSLICTLFLFMLCLTGLPLIFHDELDEALGAKPAADTVAADAPLLSVDRMIAIAKAARPNDVITFASPDDDGDPLWYFTIAPALTAPKLNGIVTVDAHTGRVLAVGDTVRSPISKFLLDLHSELLLDEKGMLFLGAMGLCIIIAIISGVVVYGPFMRRLNFGTARVSGTRRLYWLDMHNLTGIVMAAWLVVVSLTGIINTLSPQIARHWQRTELAEMIAPWRGAPVPPHLVPVQAALDTALAANPGMKVSSIAMPGTLFAGGHHYNVFLIGDEPLTSKLLKPVLINAADGTLSDSRSLPWYAKALFISKPLHFGDYGGMPLKIIWGLLDLVTLVVLGSGIYLWLARPLSARHSATPASSAGASLSARQP